MKQLPTKPRSGRSTFYKVAAIVLLVGWPIAFLVPKAIRTAWLLLFSALAVILAVVWVVDGALSLRWARRTVQPYMDEIERLRAQYEKDADAKAFCEALARLTQPPSVMAGAIRDYYRVAALHEMGRDGQALALLDTLPTEDRTFAQAVQNMRDQLSPAPAAQTPDQNGQSGQSDT